MHKLFLYRLYRHSRLAFLLSILFIAIYALLLIKKMDMVLFPYNNMFALSPNNKIATTYQMKINSRPVLYTHFQYWKKDFLEASVGKYAAYLQNDNKLYLNEYLNEKKWPITTTSLLENRLIPHKDDSWPIWYCDFAGYKAQRDEKLDIYRYKIDFNSSHPIVIDSVLIYTTIVK